METGLFQSTLPVWGATSRARFESRGKEISIHAPRVGSDYKPDIYPIILQEFQSTLPVWGATDGLPGAAAALEFQSTLPVWGATTPPWARPLWTPYFNPRSPCGERPLVRESYSGSELFQSTLPVWGATRPDQP